MPVTEKGPEDWRVSPGPAQGPPQNPAHRKFRIQPAESVLESIKLKLNIVFNKRIRKTRKPVNRGERHTKRSRARCDTLRRGRRVFSRGRMAWKPGKALGSSCMPLPDRAVRKGTTFSVADENHDRQPGLPLPFPLLPVLFVPANLTISTALERVPSGHRNVPRSPSRP